MVLLSGAPQNEVQCELDFIYSCTGRPNDLVQEGELLRRRIVSVTKVEILLLVRHARSISKERLQAREPV